MTADADRHLLFGLLALQNGIINQGQLVAAFQAWTLDKSMSLADHLEARGDLTGAKRSLLEALAEVHLDAHGGDVEKSLAAVSAGKSTQESLARIGGPEVEATLARVGTGSHESNVDHDRTMTLAVGTATSDGQRFRVLRPHARGGLGAVFVALDGELNREVALKQILDHHADDPSSRQRFLVEAEITGGLEHPGIVPVYGLGTYDGGRPYYAMRFIRGDSLKEAIEEFHRPGRDADPGARSLALRKLLRRFTDVCNAIEYAHSRGVLHRDIKPGNVIVGKHGETLVVDWGLAKPLGKAEVSAEGGERVLMPSSASGSAETLPGSALGTPAYMSPEQAAGDIDRLGPRSDVYSLGATLYSLLTGKAPFDGDVGEVLRKVQKGDFARPRQLDPSIDPALEAVCLKAMSTRFEDRYPSCRALAEDVEQWAADEPVTAWREPLARRARRWAKQNRTVVTGAAVALVAGVVGLSAVLAVQTKANADLTRSKAAVQDRYVLAVAAIKAFHTGVSEDFLIKEDKFKELRDRLLTSASDFYGKLGAVLGKETDFASRRALAQANFEVADLTEKVGRPEDALAAHRAVLARRDALASDPAADIETKSDVGRSQTAVAALLESTGKTVEAEATYRKAEALLAGLARSSPSDPTARAALAACRWRLGSLLSTTGKAADALAVYRLARADQEAPADAPGATNEAQRDLARTIHGIGIVLSHTGKPTEAEAEFRKALALYQTLVDDNPAVTEFRSNLAGIHHDLGIVLSNTGKPAEAEAEYRTALTIRQKLADDNPAVTKFRSDLALGQLVLGNLLSRTGKPTQAEAEYHRALEIQQKLADDNPAITKFRNDLATSHRNLGNLLSQTGKPAKAESEFRTALTLNQKLADDNPAVTDFRSRLAISHRNLGLLLSQTGKPAEAEAEFRMALTLNQKLADDNPAITEFRNFQAVCHNSLGWLLSNTGKPSEAEAEYRTALALQQKLADDNPAVTNFRNQLAVSHNSLGNLLSQTGKPAEAEAEFRTALALNQKLADDNPAVTEFQNRLADSHLSLGNLLSRTGKPSEAEAEFRTALALNQKLADDNPAVTNFQNRLANSHIGLGNLLSRTGKPSEAEAEYRTALAIQQKLADDNPAFTQYQHDLASSLSRMGKIQKHQGRTSEAATSFRRAVAIMMQLPTLMMTRLYDLACYQSLLAGVVDESRAEADRAMDTLRRAVAGGYRDLALMRTDTDLDPLRNRPDFQLLMMDLAMPADPFARGN